MSRDLVSVLTKRAQHMRHIDAAGHRSSAPKHTLEELNRLCETLSQGGPLATFGRGLPSGGLAMAGATGRGALQGRVAVVAGATRGAGRGIAAALGEAGATVICTGRSTGPRRSEYN